MRLTVNSRLRTVGLAALLLTTGTVLGPVAVAAISALFPEQGPYGGSIEAQRLVEAYRNRLAPFRLFLTLTDPPNGEECGYEPEVLFPVLYIDARPVPDRAQIEQYLEAYEQLRVWKNFDEGERYVSDITMWIDKNVGPYEVAFLRRCIESTIVSPYCMNRVESFGNAVERFPKTDNEVRRRAKGITIVCSYLDGYALRRGLPIAPLAARNPDWKWSDEPKR
ncbi:hypothetical protein ABS767_11945 [Sphingomonas sp. ST-64]|uniref:Uncharacterized protein n=1 Tax=Sphingomonas plantiphila TaxID=3163295 RepID=A0ABW8YN18_9SPHN